MLTITLLPGRVKPAFINSFRVKSTLKKCEFHVQETDFLGHRITQEGIQTEQNKVLAIQEWPVPTNLRELQQFVGMINYY